MKGQGHDQQSSLHGMLKRGIRIACLVVSLAPLSSGCATQQPPLQDDIPIPFATIYLPLSRDIFDFRGTAAYVTKDAVWVVVPGEQQLYKIDPMEKRLIDIIPVGAKLNTSFFAPQLLLAETGNALWAVAENTVIRIDPKTGLVVARIPVEEQKSFIVSASDSAVWVGTLGSFWSWVPHYTVSKIDPQTNRVTATLPQELSMRSARVTGENDVLWFLDGWAETLSRLDPTSGQVVASIALGRLSHPHWPAAVGEGAIWVLNAREGNVIRINPETNQVTATIPLPDPANFRPDEFYGPPQIAGGAVWVASTSGWSGFGISPTLVYAIDPNTNHVVATLNAQTYIYSVGRFALGHDALWIPMIKDLGNKNGRLVLEVHRLPHWKAAAR